MRTAEDVLYQCRHVTEVLWCSRSNCRPRADAYISDSACIGATARNARRPCVHAWVDSRVGLSRPGVDALRARTLWFFGLSGAGKSTLADALHRRLVAQFGFAIRLDGDQVRRGLCADLGFSPQDRRENLRRAAEVARIGNDANPTHHMGLDTHYAGRIS